MGYLFFDIETNVGINEPESGLNPYKEESKVLSIAYNYYSEFKLSEKILKKPTILKSWESDEKFILEEFYNFLKIKNESDQHLKLIGFNHIKFDIPYLIGRLNINNISTKNEVFDTLYRVPHFIDLAQLSQIVNRNKFKEILNINQLSANRFFGIPLKKVSGKKVTEYFRNKEYDKIIEYIYSEFTFELLYLKLKKYIYGTEQKTTEAGNE